MKDPPQFRAPMSAADGTARPPRPEPIACLYCGRLSDWEWDGEEWWVEGEWWGKAPDFYDRRWCYLNAHPTPADDPDA